MYYSLKNEIETQNFQRACAALLPEFIKVETGINEFKSYRLVAYGLMSGGYAIYYTNPDYTDPQYITYKNVIDDDCVDCIKYMRKLLNIVEVINENEFKELNKEFKSVLSDSVQS